MAGVATARDVEEVIQKLHSDRARVRDVGTPGLLQKQTTVPSCFPADRFLCVPQEGVKLLGTWLQGHRAASFCRLLGRNTARGKPGHGHLTGAATWPFLILALLNCVKEDISCKKRGATKSTTGRMLRIAIQCAEDVKLSGFVALYMKKVATVFDAKFSNHASSKDESFRCTLTLHVLLENPPGDYPDIMREDVINGFIAIFSHIRQSLFITYAKVQLKLARAIPEILEKLVDIIIKELDKNANTGPGFLWCEAPRDEKAGSLRCFQEELMDLSATVFYLAHKITSKTPNKEKRLKTEHIMDLIIDGLSKGSLFCVMSHANAIRFQDSILWLLRALKEFSMVLTFNPREEAEFCLTKSEVRQVILLNLCRNTSASSETVSSMVHLINDTRDRGNQDILLDLVNKATELSSADWFSRIKLIDCISSFICLFPDVAQDLIGCLLDMLHDTDYRVSSTIGAKMVAFSINSPVTAREVLAVGPQPVPVIETALITLAHLSVHSEDVEVECVFMISAAAAIEPSQRELVYALFDSISRRLGYSSRSKYLGHVMGPILFRWVACGMSLVSLVEVQEMFGYRSAEPKNFVEHCSSWLLPFLILRGDAADLNWISKILSQPLSVIIKRYFVQIFGLSIAARCGTGPEKDLAETALCESLLQLGEIPEVERDDLIKKHMVSIVAFLLSISSSAHGPQIPYFSKEVIALAVKTVVDGFVDTMDDELADTVVIDKINIFRPDRVFKRGRPPPSSAPLLLIPPLPRCVSRQAPLPPLLPAGAEAGHQAPPPPPLPAGEVGVDLQPPLAGSVVGRTMGPTVGVVQQPPPLTPAVAAAYHVELVDLAAAAGLADPAGLADLAATAGPRGYAGSLPLDRGMRVVVPTLLNACLTNEKEERSGTPDSSRILSLLQQLTVDADPLLYDYIRELEPLPDLDCLKDIREFHTSLSVSYASRDQFLKGILSTAKGLNVLQSLDSLDRSLLMIHSRGVNIQIVEQTILGMEKYSSVSLEDSDTWQTDSRTYKQWLCTLVSSLICHCDDIILSCLRSLENGDSEEFHAKLCQAKTLGLLDKEWNFIMFQTEDNLDLYEPFLAFRRALLKLEEAKLLRAQGQHDMAISLGKYILQKHSDKKDISDVYRSRTIIEDYLRPSVDLTEFKKSTDKSFIESLILVTQVQSYKFIPLVYQIASRLGSSNTQGSTNFQIALASLLKKMAIDHPYHTIFQLLALANGDRVKDKQRSRSSFVVDMEKKLAAENLLKELSSCHGALICQMKQMVEIYIKLAELETKKEDTNKRIPLPREVRSICQLELVPVVTATIPVDPSCRYEDGSFPHFSGLADSIMIMNGINAPKVIECFGSDGNKYRQLAKSGNDDLRQDAVVPFTPSAGVVEWVNGTVPLGDYLLGSTRISGAHGRYGTGDWTYLQCREYLMSVGYIVGLGDRHSMNILIDQDTAEVVHIDLGVAFEQGLMLKTPERVPFRLTRDIIDGMGVTGVEGVFRRCCEKTLSVMRANKEALLTIIEVFIHDPLYKWALSPLKALQRQKDTDYTDSCLDDSQEAYEGNKDAARAILRIKQKLDGSNNSYRMQ
nr:unnamed protein product [Digitaria exilis]